MRVEGETAYEPDILIEMSRHEELKADGSRKVWREAMVLKDRSTLLDGKVLGMPSYASFEAAIEYLLSDAVSQRPDNSVSDRTLVPAIEEGEAMKRRRLILIEEIEGLLAQGAPGNPQEKKRYLAFTMETVFKTRSWTEVKGLPLAQLESGSKKLSDMVGAVSPVKSENPDEEPSEV
jgi:hypothetical protein